MAINILIADDHPITRSGYLKELDSVPNIKVVGTAADGMKVIDLYEDLKPDVVIVDISMPLLSGIDAAKKILKNDKKANVLFCSVTIKKSEIFQTYNIGGRGFISKDKPVAKLIEAINTCYSGALFFDDVFTENDYHGYLAVKEEVSFHNQKITEKEKEVLELIAQNFTNKEMAEKLFVCERTIEQRRRRMRAKLGLKGSLELIKFAIDYTSKN